MMNKIKAMLYGSIIFLLTSMTTSPLMADFSGPYAGVQMSVNGVELDGSTTDSNSQVQNGAGGMFGIAGGIDAGWNIPLGDKLFLGVGGMLNPGDAKLKVDAGGAAGGNTTDVSIEFSDMVTWYVQPGIAISDNSAVYLKFGHTSADLTITGDVTKLSSLDGTTYGIGTVSKADSGLFIKTEAGWIDFDSMKLTGLGSANGIATTNSATANPTSAYGQVSIGIQF
jgi:hypothetical protein